MIFAKAEKLLDLVILSASRRKRVTFDKTFSNRNFALARKLEEDG